LNDELQDLNARLYSARNALHTEQLKKVDQVKSEFPEGLKLKFEKEMKELRQAKLETDSELH